MAVRIILKQFTAERHADGLGFPSAKPATSGTWFKRDLKMLIQSNRSPEYGQRSLPNLLKILLLPQNPVGFRSYCRLFGHAEEFFREVGHGDERFEFRGDLLGNILSFSEGVAESVDIDFSEDFFEGCFSTEQDRRWSIPESCRESCTWRTCLPCPGRRQCARANRP